MTRPAAVIGRIHDMRGLGPATERMLAEIDVTTPDELRAIGADEAFRRLRFRHGEVSTNALHAMEGALTDRDWREVARSPRIVPAKPTHAPACAAILDAWIDENGWMPRLHTREAIETHVRDVVFAMRRAWVALENDTPIGFLALDIEGCITALYVAAPARGRGVGHTLLDAAKAEERALTLWAFEPNVGARRFYEREGFVEVRQTDGDNEEGVPDVLMGWKADDCTRAMT